MKWTLLLLVVMGLPACQSRRIVKLPSGAEYEDWGHLAGNTLVAVKPDGTFVAYNKMNQPWQDFMQALTAIAAAREAADVGVVASTNRRIIRLGSQRQATLQAGLANDLQKLKLAKELEEFRLLHPTATTLPALP